MLDMRILDQSSLNSDVIGLLNKEANFKILCTVHQVFDQKKGSKNRTKMQCFVVQNKNVLNDPFSLCVNTHTDNDNDDSSCYYNECIFH